MTLQEKVKELYYEQKEKLGNDSKYLAWETHKELRKFLKENPEYHTEWFSDIY